MPEIDPSLSGTWVFDPGHTRVGFSARHAMVTTVRGTFTEVAGITQPGPAPRFSRTPGEVRRPPPHAGQHSDEVLAELGYDEKRIAALKESGAIA